MYQLPPSALQMLWQGWCFPTLTAGESRSFVTWGLWSCFHAWQRNENGSYHPPAVSFAAPPACCALAPCPVVCCTWVWWWNQSVFPTGTVGPCLQLSSWEALSQVLRNGPQSMRMSKTHAVIRQKRHMACASSVKPPLGFVCSGWLLCHLQHIRLLLPLNLLEVLLPAWCWTEAMTEPSLLWHPIQQPWSWQYRPGLCYQVSMKQNKQYS